MRRDIRVEIVRGFDGLPDDGFRAIRISYRGDDPLSVAQVCNQLASMFINDNLLDRQQQVVSTHAFIDEQLRLAKKALEEAEDSVDTAKSKGERAVAALDLSRPSRELCLAAEEETGSRGRHQSGDEAAGRKLRSSRPGDASERADQKVQLLGLRVVILPLRRLAKAQQPAPATSYLFASWRALRRDAQPRRQAARQRSTKSHSPRAPSTIVYFGTASLCDAGLPSHAR